MQTSGLKLFTQTKETSCEINASDEMLSFCICMNNIPDNSIPLKHFNIKLFPY